MTQLYTGSCHCGQVRFRVRFAAGQTTFKCNCSVCTKSRAWLAPVAADAFSLLTGEAELGEYRFGARKIQHRFCRHCGVKVFGRSADANGNAFFAVSVAALDDVPHAELAALPVQYFNGRHDDYENAPSDPSLL